MPGVWKKALGYLGLVEEEGYDEMDEVEAEAPVRPEPVSVRSMERAGSSHPALGHSEHIVRTIPQPRHASAMIHKSEPKRFNEARDLGDKFRDGVPVIMNLTEMDDADAKRLVDFAAGLIFGLRGSIERVTAKVFLLSPQNVEVTAEDKQRIAEGGFFNQS